jgi:hypothetical protein
LGYFHCGFAASWAGLRMMRAMMAMMALRLSGYGRETKRPVIGYGQRADMSTLEGGWVGGG